MSKKKVIVGMSGGVDSSVAAFLLKEQGYEVIGVTMRIWPDETAPNVLPLAVDDAGKVARALDIPYYVIDFRQEFKSKVIDYFVAEYLQGRTPNPCVVCNRYVKWESLLKKGMDVGADYIATGHYARIARLPNGRYAVRNSVTAAKDQTYALYKLTQFQLEHTLMPTGDYTKADIRRIAEREGLPVANKPDSQEICFVPDDNHTGFIEKEAKDRVPPPGNYVTKDGKILGVHKGITHYTIGQRKGLSIAMGHRIFVSEIRPDTNEVVIGEEEDVFSVSLRCNQLNFMGMDDVLEPRKVRAKIRYAHSGAPCVIERTGTDEIRCLFEEPVRAVTPGQAVVFYEGEYVLGGGTIL